MLTKDRLEACRKLVARLRGELAEQVLQQKQHEGDVDPPWKDWRESRAEIVSTKDIDAILDAYERIAALPAYWKQVTPPSDWPVMRRFIADVEKALTQPRKDM